ncbi:MAG: hypothetical protein IKV16_02635 [Clostridia bacterium]|nr:hypothetical protein [Clostridia bacterium]
MSKKENISKNEYGFYRVYAFMTQELKLHNSELRTYAIIFSYTNGSTGMYYGTQRYLAKTLDICERTLQYCLTSLKKKGLIENVFDEMSGRSGIRCSYMKEGEKKDENSDLVARLSEKALDNLVVKKYGKLPENLHLATRAAIRNRLEREAREKEIDALVRRVRREMHTQSV